MKSTSFLPRRWTIVALSTLAAASLAGCATGYDWSPYPADDHLESLSAHQWREDITYLRRELPKRNPHLTVDPQLGRWFDKEAAALASGITDSTSPGEIIVGISRLLAGLGEGHTSINAGPHLVYPVSAHWFADSFSVVAVDVDHREIVGAEVLGIRRPNGVFVDAQTLEVILRDVISVDHPNGYRLAAGQRLMNPYLMRGLGLADENGLDLVVAPNGRAAETRTIRLSPRPYRETQFVGVAQLRDRTPLSASRTEPMWWTRTGETDEIVYVSYQSSRLDAFGFFRSVLKEIRDDRTTRVIIDIRANSGGASIAGTRFAAKLGRIRRLREPGSIFVLIGPRTFSSGMMLAVDLMDKTDAIFIGEPLAETPTSWGEVTRFPLPNSELMIGTSTKLFRYGRGKDLRTDEDGIIVPDIVIRRTFDQYLAGVDPVLDAAISFDPPGDE